MQLAGYPAFLETRLDSFDLFEEDSTGLDEARQTQQQLVDSQERLGAVLEALPVGLLIHTAQGILYANAAAAMLLQTSANALSGHHLLDYLGAEDAPAANSALSRALSGERGTHTAEFVVERRDGTRRVAGLILGRLPWAGNPVLQIILQDVTDQKHAEASLRQLTITDELTGAYNRRHAVYEAGLYIGEGSDAALPFSVVMIDIDHFKRINDKFGHGTGDEVLIALTRLMHDLLPTFRDANSAMFARIGGEEFVILLPGVGPHRAMDIAERVREAIKSVRVATNDAGDVRFTASLGTATFQKTDHDFQGVLKRADSALYAAKQSGRDRVVAG